MRNIPVRHINDVSKEPDFSGIFTVRSVEEMLGGKEMVQQLHRHDFYFILILKKGLGSHQIDFIDYQIKDYTVFLMRPGQVHQLHLKAGSSGYLLQFSNTFSHSQDKSVQQLLRKVNHLNLCKLNAVGFEKLDLNLKYILREYTEKHEGYLDVIKSSLTIFFIELIRQRQHDSVKSGSNSYAQEKLETFVDLIEKHHAEQKSVVKYAEMLHLTTYQLNSICKTTLNKTASEVISDYIILESKRRLLATSNQINNIAYDLGYEDVSYFIRYFKKYTGHSPAVFRENFR